MHALSIDEVRCRRLSVKRQFFKSMIILILYDAGKYLHGISYIHTDIHKYIHTDIDMGLMISALGKNTMLHFSPAVTQEDHHYC